MTKLLQLANPIDFLVEIILVGLIFFSPLVCGSVTIAPITVCELACLFLVVLWLVKTIFFNQPIVILRIPYAALSGVILLICFQLIPLPTSIVSAFFQNTYRVFSDFSARTQNFITLSIYPDATAGMLLQVISYIIVFFVTLQCVNTERQRRRIVLAILICGFLYSLYGIVHRLHVSDSSFSTFINRNHFAAYIGMIIPMALCFALIQTDRLKAGVTIFMAVIMFIALISTLSRAALICSVMSLSMLIVLLVIKGAVPPLSLALLAGLTVLYVSILGQSVDMATISVRLKTFLSPSSMILGRLNLLKDGVRIIRDFPLAGTGIGTFGEAFPLYNTLGTPEKVFSFAHNEAIQATVEMGIPCILLLTIFAVSLGRRARTILRRRKTGHAYYVVLGCGTGILSIGMHSFFDFVFHIPANMYLFCILLGVGLNTVVGETRANPMSSKDPAWQRSRVVRIFCAAVLIAFVFNVGSVIIKRYAAQATFDKAIQQLSEVPTTGGIDYAKIISAIDRAISFNDLNSSYYAKKADLLADEIMKKESWSPLSEADATLYGKEDIFIRAAQCYKRAIDLNPTNSHYHLKLGWLLSVIDLNAQANNELDKAIILNPRSISTHLYVCEYLLAQKSIDDFNRCLHAMVRLFEEERENPINEKVWPFLKKIEKEGMVKNAARR